MKHVTTDVEVFKTNVLNVEIELNSFAQFEKGLPRQVWDPGLKCDKILLQFTCAMFAAKFLSYLYYSIPIHQQL